MVNFVIMPIEIIVIMLLVVSARKAQALEFINYGLYSSDSKTVMCLYCKCTITWDRERKGKYTKLVQSEKHVWLKYISTANTSYCLQSNNVV